MFHLILRYSIILSAEATISPAPVRTSRGSRTGNKFVQRVPPDFQPPALRELPKPCQLPLREVPAARLNPLDRCVQRRPTLYVRHDFRIAEGLHRLPARRPPQPEQRPHFIDPAGR